ncbi:MAG: 2-hydroxy-3-oxopropionate reductase [Actinomycetaceae bacterium]|nr:2-hydroxy-3-oxopropionate reductase [Actinomycetaceae bacterium]
MAKVGIVGLGIMGLPMMKNVLAAGHEVVGYDRNESRIDELVKAGGKAAANVAEACKGVDFFITMVPDSPHVQDIVHSEGGLLDSAEEGLLWADMSTIRPDVSQQLAKDVAKKGIRALDAPVSGGEQGAIDAVLSIMVGGEEKDFDAAKPFFDLMGKTVVYLGPSGSGQTVKAANQLIVGMNFQAIAEAIVFLEAFGVDTEAAIDVLGGGLAGSRCMELKGKSMLARKFEPGFRIDLHHKDFGIITQAAREAGVVIPGGSLIAQLMESARANGDGGLDHSALMRGVLRMSGKEV